LYIRFFNDGFYLKQGAASWQALPNIVYGNQPNRWNNPIEFAEHSNPSQTSAITGSPVNLHAYDEQGRHVGLNESGDIEIQIPNTYLYIPSNDSKEIIVILSSNPITFIINATDNGAFNLSINKFDRNTSTQINLEYNNILITKNTTATLSITPTNPNFIMQIDINGDGIIDNTTLPDNITIEGNNTNNETDSDNDGISDSTDNCPNLPNPNQITDFDGDGFDNLLCGGNDCDDTNNNINPEAQEVCNLVDDNCNGKIDDVDIDGINDCSVEDLCSDSVPDNFPDLKKNHFAGNWLGCSCTQILECKPGKNIGELKHGCTKGTINVWLQQTGWAANCKG